MDKFKGNKGNPKFGKQKENPKSKFQVPSKCQVLKSTKSKQAKNSTSEEKVSLDVKETGKNPDTNEIPSKGKENKSKFQVPSKCQVLKSTKCKQAKNSSTEEKVSLQVKETGKNPNTNEIPSKGKENGVLRIDTEYEAFSDYSNITVPLVGKSVFQNDEKPFTKRYDLAEERNKRRFAYMKETGEYDEILKLIETKSNLSESDNKKNAIIKKNKNINMACYLTELCSKILKELKDGKDKIRERKIVCYLRKFLLAPVTPTCLLYVPHLVHTIAYIRGNKAFSKILRLTANECYDKSRAMFPIPPGYNFETVYTSEMRKFLPDTFEKFENKPLDYGDIYDILENCDSEDYNTLVTVLYDANIKISNKSNTKEKF